MFTCQQCHKPTGPKIKPVKKVTETRPRDYENVYQKQDEETGLWEKFTVRSKGWEIVKEINLCPSCAEPAPTIEAKEVIQAVSVR